MWSLSKVTNDDTVCRRPELIAAEYPILQATSKGPKEKKNLTTTSSHPLLPCANIICRSKNWSEAAAPLVNRLLPCVHLPALRPSTCYPLSATISPTTLTQMPHQLRTVIGHVEASTATVRTQEGSSLPRYTSSRNKIFIKWFRENVQRNIID